MPVGKQSIQRATRALKKDDAEVSVPETSTKGKAGTAAAQAKESAAAKPAAPAKKKPGRKPGRKPAAKTTAKRTTAHTPKTYTQVSRMHCELPTYLL